MTALAARAPLETRDRWKLRLVATGAALLLGTGIFMIQRMPSAQTLKEGDAELVATSTQTMALYNLRAAPVLQFDGALGAGLRVSVSTARPTPALRKSLTALGLQVPNVKGARLQWQARPPAEGRIAVRIRNDRQAPDAGMMLRATGSGQIPELNIRAVSTVLTVQVDVTPGDGGEVSFAELNFAELNSSDPALAFAPLQFEVPPGESLNLTFDSAAALSNSDFRLGELLESGGTATALSLGRVEAGRLAAGPQQQPRLRSVIHGVCAAPTGKLLLTHLYPRPPECTLGKVADDDDLFATNVEIEPRKVTLALEGSGFVIDNGRTRPAAFWSALMANPIIAALVGGLVFAIARPLWRLWTGRDM